MSKQNKYEIQKVKTDEETIIDCGNLPSHPFFCTLVAGPGSGKTSVIMNILLNPLLYGDSKKKTPYWNNIIYISPSYLTDKTLAPLRKLQQDEDNDKITITAIYEDLENMDVILRTICDHLNEMKEEHKEENIKTIIVIDDSSTLMNKKSDKTSYIARIVSTYRHIGYSLDCLFVSQRYLTIPQQLRVCSSCFLIYRINNKKDLKAICDELGGVFGDDKFLECYEEATQEKYSFMTVDMRKLTLRKKFNDLLFKKD